MESQKQEDVFKTDASFFLCVKEKEKEMRSFLMVDAYGNIAPRHWRLFREGRQQGGSFRGVHGEICCKSIIAAGLADMNLQNSLRMQSK